MLWHKEYGHSTNTKHQRSQFDCFLISVFGFFLQNHFGLLWKVSGCHGLLVTMTPFPHVTANAESIF